MTTTILKALVGSQAHGLAGPDSDYDWRGVFVAPTSEILSIGGTTRQTSWLEGKEDDTSWEVRHFLEMATHSNPSVLEVLWADQWRDRVDPWASELLWLRGHLWSSRGVRDAFIGYGRNQRKKFLDDRDVRPAKYAVAYLRTLYNAWVLLTTGNFNLNVAGTPIEPTLRLWRQGIFTPGEVINVCGGWEAAVNEAYEKNPDRQTNLAPVNDYLLRLRGAFW